MATIGVVLSGCGVMDGSEIHEAVSALLAIDRAGAQAICMAPDAEQDQVVNHLTGDQSELEHRNILVESARIARGKIRDIAGVGAEEIDALFFPGGFGAAKNLCTFARDGADCSVRPEVERLVTEVHNAGKPIGAVCIAPVLIAKVFADQGPFTLTVGNDKSTSEAIEKMGHKHQDCPVTECVVDKENKVVTSPAYMLAESIGEVAEGVDKAVRAVMDML